MNYSLFLIEYKLKTNTRYSNQIQVHRTTG